MKKTSILCALTFAVVFTTGTAKAVEPSEKEMLLNTHIAHSLLLAG